MWLLNKLLDLVLPDLGKVKWSSADQKTNQGDPLRLANTLARTTLFAIAARHRIYESRGFEITLRAEHVGSRRLWETLKFTSFRLSHNGAGSNETVTIEGKVEYHLLDLKDSSMPETYADDKQRFGLRATLSRNGSIRPELQVPVVIDWRVLLEKLPEHLPR